jgi:ArsR family transcriptional regulator, virulence genes transcriptional regulator
MCLLSGYLGGMMKNTSPISDQSSTGERNHTGDGMDAGGASVDPALLMAGVDVDAMNRAADEAAGVLKILSNPARLRILCALVPGEQSVGELEMMLGASQSYVSGQLAKMRVDGLVACDRDGRIIRYRIADPRIGPILERLYEVFCPAVSGPN